MKTWVGYFRQNGKKHFMNFEFFQINSNFIDAQGIDEFGNFIFNGVIKGNYFEAIKIYQGWDINYLGVFDEIKREIFGYWAYNKGDIRELFEIKEINTADLIHYSLMHSIIKE